MIDITIRPFFIRLFCRLLRSAAHCVQREVGSEKLPGHHSGNEESRASTAASNDSRRATQN
ncbi:hypothetical protein K788_0005951 [Paraburkholderia caribensis MBA4]|uniref:Uncharacterized protein n=1 Tax=Paraburkholderia caribensis MBA4 TaxID=1323664 RepID=A0A0P0R498_9BURK|nr:hypothetical protein [Paraburkholderia caribensis]ALL62895.1 hypothetical protein K788_0005951 [Paraburkholderia caribensis MBA4]